jgi:hypothetical protein
VVWVSTRETAGGNDNESIGEEAYQ